MRLIYLFAETWNPRYGPKAAPWSHCGAALIVDGHFRRYRGPPGTISAATKPLNWVRGCMDGMPLFAPAPFNTTQIGQRSGPFFVPFPRSPFAAVFFFTQPLTPPKKYAHAFLSDLLPYRRSLTSDKIKTRTTLFKATDGFQFTNPATSSTKKTL